MIDLIIYALATFGVSALLSEYDGPWGVFLKLRLKYRDSAFHCTVCLSVWVALILFVFVLLGWAYYLAPLAVVGVVILLEKI